MGNMEFLSQNLLNTTTMLTMQASNTSNSNYLFNRRRDLGWASDGYEGVTSAMIIVALPTNTVISNIMFLNHNLRQFRGFYNSFTSNSLLDVSGNSATSSYYDFASVTVNSINIEMDLAGSSAGVNANKSIGEFVVAERRIILERNPSSENWQIAIDRKQTVHEMPDGGVRVYNMGDKMRVRMDLDYMTGSFTSNLQVE